MNSIPVEVQKIRTLTPAWRLRPGMVIEANGGRGRVFEVEHRLTMRESADGLEDEIDGTVTIRYRLGSAKKVVGAETVRVTDRLAVIKAI